MMEKQDAVTALQDLFSNVELSGFNIEHDTRRDEIVFSADGFKIKMASSGVQRRSLAENISCIKNEYEKFKSLKNKDA